MSQILAVIPAYNEAGSIPDLLSNYDTVYTQSLSNLSILIVNDGSKDHTVDTIKRFNGKINITLIDNAVNGGLGKVIRQGLMAACNMLHDDDIIITKVRSGIWRSTYGLAIRSQTRKQQNEYCKDHKTHAYCTVAISVFEKV